MRVWVQMPCLDAAHSIGPAIRSVPRSLAGGDRVSVLVIDDGSRDRTAQAAEEAGADRVVRLPHTQGHARAFAEGLDQCLWAGADVIVNLDEDHGFEAGDLDRLVEPIRDGRADIVVGHRETAGRARVRPMQRLLRALCSRTVSVLARMHVPDATSGVRAYSREAALRLNVFSRWAYTLDTLVQAGKKDLVVTHVPVVLRDVERPVRPPASLRINLKRSMATLLRVYALYEPLRTFFYAGAVMVGVGLVGVLRFLYFWASGDGSGHIQSLTISGVLLVIGFQLWMLGILADVLSVNRRLTEDMLCRLKREEIGRTGEGAGDVAERHGRS
jgi:glycosyltransferase involved in cell wall biosynthesis